jgi:hypothetical protein
MGARPAVALLLLALILVPAAGGAGPPEPRVRDGVTASSWRLRPGTLVTPERRVFRILVTESACAGGQPASGRVEEPLVIRERTRVQVAMFVRPLGGPATCPSNPPTPYTLRLDRALGDRTLADGGTIPPRPVRGRLTRRGYQRAVWRIVSDTAEPTRLYDALVVRRRPVAECSYLMGDFTGRVGVLLDRVAGLDPPPAVAGIQREFLDAAWRSWRRLEEVGADVAAGRVRCGRDLHDRIYGMPSSTRAERAIARLERRGYRVFGE